MLDHTNIDNGRAKTDTNMSTTEPRYISGTQHQSFQQMKALKIVQSHTSIYKQNMGFRLKLYIDCMTEQLTLKNNLIYKFFDAVVPLKTKTTPTTGFNTLYKNLNEFKRMRLYIALHRVCWSTKSTIQILWFLDTHHLIVNTNKNNTIIKKLQKSCGKQHLQKPPPENRDNFRINKIDIMAEYFNILIESLDPNPLHNVLREIYPQKTLIYDFRDRCRKYTDGQLTILADLFFEAFWSQPDIETITKHLYLPIPKTRCLVNRIPRRSSTKRLPDEEGEYGEMTPEKQSFHEEHDHMYRHRPGGEGSAEPYIVGEEGEDMD